MFRRSPCGLVRTVAALAGVLVLAASSHLGARQAPPPASQIVERFIKAIGGRDAYKKITSLRATGTFELTGQGIRGSFEMMQARPARSLVKTTIDGIGKIEIGYNGTHGWQIDPMSGPSLLSGRQLTEIADEAWFDGPLYEPGFVKSMTTVERTTFDQKPAYKVQVVFASGSEEFQFFDAETGLRLGTESRRQTPLGVVPTSSYWRDYKPFGPLLQPTVIVQRPLGIEQVVRLTTFEYDVVPASAFDPPAEVKALIKTDGGPGF
jgi:zinc protease